MPIQLECNSCGRRLKVKDERAGRRIRCPGCQEAIEVPADADDFDDPFADEARRSSRKPQRPRSISGKRQRSGQKAKAEKSGFRRHWHWLALAVMMLFALWPGPGLVIVGLFSAVGVGMVLIGGIYPFLRVFFGAPGTVLLMILSRSARFDMMRAPDNHPYKVLMRTAFDPTRGLFWKGVLLIVMFIPGAIINKNLPELFKSRGPEADPQIAGENPNLIQPARRPVGPGPQNRGGFAPQGRANPNPVGENEPHAGNGAQAGFRPRRTGTVSQPQGDRNGNVVTLTITYESFTGGGSVQDSARSAIKIMSGFVEDSLQIDEESQTIQFQHRGRVAVPAVAKLFGQHGFPKLSVKMSNR